MRSLSLSIGIALMAAASAFPQIGAVAAPPPPPPPPPPGAATAVFTTGGGIGNGAGLGFSGPGGMTSSRSDSQGTTFTYSFPKGATINAETGAPYSGRESSQTVRTLGNGTHLTQQMNGQPMTYRDTMGRTRTDLVMMDRPAFAAAAANFTPQITRLPEISDPVGGYRIILDPVHQIAHRVSVQVRQIQALNPNTVVAGRSMAMPERTMANGATIKTESLGTQTMFGVSVIGTRTTQTYPVGTYQGNDQPVEVINEHWDAPQYGLTLLSKNTGPNGDTTRTMKNFSANEPDPALFMIPAGYQIVDETGDFTITIPRGATVAQ